MTEAAHLDSRSMEIMRMAFPAEVVEQMLKAKEIIEVEKNGTNH